jgi:hypothetical protein
MVFNLWNEIPVLSLCGNDSGLVSLPRLLRFSIVRGLEGCLIYSGSSGVSKSHTCFQRILIRLTESERDRADSVPSGHPFAFGYAMKQLN